MEKGKNACKTAGGSLVYCKECIKIFFFKLISETTKWIHVNHIIMKSLFISSERRIAYISKYNKKTKIKEIIIKGKKTQGG